MTFKEILKKWNHGQISGAQAKLAEKFKINPGTVSRWAKGLSEPEEDIRPKIAKELGVSVEQLMACFPQRPAGGAGFASEPILGIPGIQQVTYVPVLGVVSAETFKEAIETPLPLHDPLPIPYEVKGGRKAFALKISGDCMLPKAQDGEYAIVVETSYVADGSLAVVCWDGECTLKRLYRRGDHLELKPDNPDHHTLRKPAAACRIVGQVIGFWRKP